MGGKVEPDISNTSLSVGSYAKNINLLVGEVYIMISFGFSTLSNGIFEKKTDRATTFTELAYGREKMLKRQRRNPSGSSARQRKHGLKANPLEESHY